MLALRELSEKKLLGDFVTPIIEPVKLSPTLNKTMSSFIQANQSLSVIRNPVVGSFLKDLKDVEDGSKDENYKKEFLAQYDESAIIKSVIMQPNANLLLEHWEILTE